MQRPLESSKEAGSKQALCLRTLHPEMQWMFLPSINLCRTEKDVENVLCKKVHVCVNIRGYCLESLRSSNEYILYEHSHSQITKTFSLPFHIAHRNSSQSHMNTKRSYNV